MALGALTALALALRLVGIDQSLYGDEDFTYYIVTRNGLGGVWRDVYETSITPPLHYFLAWASIQFGGDDTILVRLPSLILGTALVPLAFATARRIAGDRAGFVAALVVALSPFAVWYSDEARAYATLMFLVAASVYALLRALDGDGTRWLVIYALSACGAIWTHYTAVFVVAGMGLWALWAHRDRWRALALAQVGIAVGYLPWIPGFLNQRQNEEGVEIIGGFSSLSLATPFDFSLRTLVGHTELQIDLGILPGRKGLLLVLVLAVVAGVAVATHRLARRRGLAPLLRSEAGLAALLAVATPLGLLLYAAVGSSLFLPRNFSASLPALAVLVGVLVGRLTELVPQRLATVAAVALVAALGLGALQSLGDDYLRPPYRKAVRHLEQTARPGDPVVQVLVTGENSKLPPNTLDRYLERERPVYSSAAAAPAWRQLRSGREVHVVTPRLLRSSALLERELEGDQRVPARLSDRRERLGGPNGRAILRGERSFPGVQRVDLLRYRGMVEGRLERRRGREVISWSLGGRVTVSTDGARGSIESITPSGEPLAISGWALDGTGSRPPEWVLLFSRGRLFAVSAGGGRRPDIARTYGESALLSGFGLLPLFAPADHATIRVFAVRGDQALELPFGAAAKRSLR